MSAIEAFLREVDAAWRQPGPRIRLRIIGSTALMLQTAYYRGTKDSDVLETDEVTDAVAERLLHIAGPGTEIHTRRAMYIDIVRRGVPFRRQSPAYHRLDELSASLEHFDVEVMSVVDVVVGKLARFNANDRSDIDAMVGRGLVDHGEVLQCFLDALDFKMDVTSDEFTAYVRHLHVVERDMLAVGESEIEEPDWLR